MPDMRNLSLYGIDAWKVAGGNSNDTGAGKSNGYARIIIRPSAAKVQPQTRPDLIGTEVRGVMLEPLSVNLDSEWTTMGEANIPFVSTMTNEVIGAMSGFSEVLGGGESGAVFKSQKLWKKSGYLNLTVKMRVVDWENTNATIEMYKNLGKYVTPANEVRYSQGLADLTDVLGKSYGDVIVGLGNVLNSETVVGVAGALGNVIGQGKLSQQIVKDAGNAVTFFGNEFKTNDPMGFGLNDNTAYWNDLGTLKYSPPPIEIEIGNYFFRDDMVIDSFNTTWSKEVSEVGPLYADFEIKMSSRALVNGTPDMGVYSGTSAKRSRVKYVGTFNNNSIKDDPAAVGGENTTPRNRRPLMDQHRHTRENAMDYYFDNAARQSYEDRTN